jgi:hypothetical protein
VHDDGEAAGERDPGFLEAAPLRDLQRPSAPVCRVLSRTGAAS